MTRTKRHNKPPASLNYETWHRWTVRRYGEAGTWRVVTAGELERARTDRGGYTRATLEALGVDVGPPGSFAPPAGWKATLIGREAPVAMLEAAVAASSRITKTTQRRRRRRR